MKYVLYINDSLINYFDKVENAYAYLIDYHDYRDEIYSVSIEVYNND